MGIDFDDEDKMGIKKKLKMETKLAERLQSSSCRIGIELDLKFVDISGIVPIQVPLSSATLGVQYYDQTCPHAEDIIYQTICNASIYDPKVPARILTMFFHDCFIRGCDASVLLDSTPGNKAEKDGPPNLSLGAFYVLDDAKTKLEKACPRTANFSSVHDTDPTLNAVFAQSLKKTCPKPNTDRNAGQFLDPTSSVFDNNYYKQIVSGKGVFASDQSLLNDYKTGWIIKAFSNDQALFFKEFAASMIKLENVVVENGEVRLNCKVLN
ncbi:hypothetical protein RND71_030112 [Anisodus tanguticus]|uniref:peroxidase n=1 Tax=Anisodus tanguticus TaxID=243964 RepID=A0AAE1V705_9SOLA|nr:hypothetical protein RND71_030112 [Anisodus tanguticus]